MFASGLELVPVDNSTIQSAADLDMILTPTEEERDGKPVVVVALGVSGEREALDQIAASLEAVGFYVARIPYVYTDSGSIAYSYNNVLMERYEEGGRFIRRVYLPNYTGYRRYNEEAAAVYRDLGYEVIPIRGMEKLGDLGGAVRCMVKVTSRSRLPDHSDTDWCVDPHPFNN